MSSEWIKVRVDLFDDPTVFRLAKILGQHRSFVVGQLVRFWCWADRHAVDGRVDGASSLSIDELSNSDGFSAALVEVGWLLIDDRGATIPNHERHNGTSAKERALKNARQARWRAGVVDGGVDAAVVAKPSTPAPTREEKRREENKEESPLPPKGGKESAKKPVKAKMTKALAEVVSIPESLANDEFRAAWADWLADRKDRGKAMTERAAAGQFRKLEPLGPAKAAECLRDSIANGWQGIFTEKYLNGKPQSGRFMSKRDQEIAEFEERMRIVNETERELNERDSFFSSEPAALGPG